MEKSIDRLSKNLLKNPQHTELYIGSINYHIKKYDIENRLKYFGILIRYILFHIRSAQEFDVQHLAYEVAHLSSLSEIPQALKLKELELIQEDIVNDRCGEMEYAMEADFQEALEKQFI
jgi:hypothetical protein